MYGNDSHALMVGSTCCLFCNIWSDYLFLTRVKCQNFSSKFKKDTDGKKRLFTKSVRTVGGLEHTLAGHRVHSCPRRGLLVGSQLWETSQSSWSSVSVTAWQTQLYPGLAHFSSKKLLWSSWPPLNKDVTIPCWICGYLAHSGTLKKQGDSIVQYIFKIFVSLFLFQENLVRKSKCWRWPQ